MAENNMTASSFFDPCHAYRRFGVSRSEDATGLSYTFRVPAPGAGAAFLVGDFIGWENGRPMTARAHGVWECKFTTQTPLEGQKYKFKLVSGDTVNYRTDPYAQAVEWQGEQASVVFTQSVFSFTDSAFLQKEAERRSPHGKPAPMHIYEADLAVFCTKEKKCPDEPFAVYGYRELGDRLIPYLKSMGYTHLLLSDSHFSSFFSVSPRFGSCEDFRFFVNKLHNNGVGILCSLPMAKAPQALSLYDGTRLYETEAGDFDVTKPLVKALLCSSLFFFTEEMHIDGFLIESSFAYTDFWEETIAELKKAHPRLLFLMKGLSRPVESALLWNTRWQEAFDRYLSCDPYFRRFHHNALNYDADASALPCGKRPATSRIAAFFGNYRDKFANNRLCAVYRAFLPAALATFMGEELAPFAPYSEAQELEWFLLNFEAHKRFHFFEKTLNHLYLASAPLWALDGKEDGFTLIDSDSEQNRVTLVRRDETGKTLIGLFHFAKTMLSHCESALPDGQYRVILHTESEAFGGSESHLPEQVAVENGKLLFDLLPLSAVILQPLS